VHLFKELSRHLLRGVEENHEKPGRVSDLGARISTQDIPNSQIEC
jgi:hypothetical protein